MTTSLITGATGFIGAVLAERLRARGERVLALVRETSNTRALIELLRHREGDAYLNWLRLLGRQLQLAIDAAAG